MFFVVLSTDARGGSGTASGGSTVRRTPVNSRPSDQRHNKDNSCPTRTIATASYTANQRTHGPLTFTVLYYFSEVGVSNIYFMLAGLALMRAANALLLGSRGGCGGGGDCSQDCLSKTACSDVEHSFACPTRVISTSDE